MDIDLAINRLYQRLYRLLKEVPPEQLGECGSHIVWLLPRPSRAFLSDASFLASQLLWGHLSSISASDGYGVEAKAYAAAICSLLGGYVKCWDIARGSPLCESYLEACRGLGRMDPQLLERWLKGLHLERRLGRLGGEEEESTLQVV